VAPEVFGEPQICNLTGLRVVDCSIVPMLVGGNTNAPAIMIGENSAKAGWGGRIRSRANRSPNPLKQQTLSLRRISV
jgi:hypothetical protein